jgi:hypothetical protein
MKAWAPVVRRADLRHPAKPSSKIVNVKTKRADLAPQR